MMLPFVKQYRPIGAPPGNAPFLVAVLVNSSIALLPRMYQNPLLLLVLLGVMGAICARVAKSSLPIMVSATIAFPLVAGLAVFPNLTFRRGVGIFTVTSVSERVAAFEGVLVGLLAMTTTASLGFALIRRRLHSHQTRALPSLASSLLWWALLGSSIGGVLLLVAAWGPSYFMLREAYLIPPANQTAAILGQYLVLPAGPAAAALLSRSHRSWIQAIAIGAAVAIPFAALLSLGSRRTAVLTATFLLPAVWRRICARRPLVKAVWLALPTFVCVYTTSVVLWLRSRQQHGLIPYVNDIMRTPLEPLSSESMSALLANLTSSLDLVAHVVRTASPSVVEASVQAGLNPLPGAAAGWDQVGTLARVNVYTPYPAIAELLLASPALQIKSIILGAGMIVCVTLLSQGIRDKGGWWSSVAVQAVFLVGVTMLLQYNLRIALRPMILSVIVGIMLLSVKRGALP